jgi:hypothetical protein
MSPRRTILPAALAAALLAAPAAEAKQVQLVKACGAHGDCRTVRAHGDEGTGLLPGGGGGPPDHRASFYRLTLTIGVSPKKTEGRIHALYAPSLGLVAMNEPGAGLEWAAAPAAAKRLANRATHGLTPLRAAKMPVERQSLPEFTPSDPPPAAATARPAPARAAGDDGTPWAALAAGSIMALAAAALAARAFTRRRGGPQSA